MTSQNVPLGTIDLGSFEVFSDHGDEVEDDESTEMMPPLPPMVSFGNIAMKITKTKRIHFFIVGMGSKSSPTLCKQMDPWARNALKSERDVKGCLSETSLSVQCAGSWECTDDCQ